jgi:putative hemolysin
MTELLVALVFLLLNAFFAGSETALLAANRIEIRALAKENHLRAKMAQKVRSNLSRTLSVILVGTNISLVACSLFATHFFLKTYPRLIVFAPFIITFMILLFGEIIPKSLSLRRPSSFSLWLAAPLVAADTILQPVAALIRILSEQALRILGIASHKELVTKRELEIAMKEGGIGFRERMIISGVFDFASKPVRKIMVPRVDVKAIEVEQPLEAFMKSAQTEGFSRYPVYEGEMDRIVGVVHVNDLLKLEGDNWSRCMKPPFFIPANMTLSSALTEFRMKRVQMAVVLDEYGGTAGIVTIEDLLEELVGEIEDEYDWKRKRSCR